MKKLLLSLMLLVGFTAVNAQNIFKKNLNQPQKTEQKNRMSRVYVKHLDGPIFFGFASRFQEMITELDDELEILIIEMCKVPYVDQSGLYVLEDSILRLQNNNVLILMRKKINLLLIISF